jgi:hypothetical protein
MHRSNSQFIQIGKSIMGLKHEALKTIYKGRILSLLLYGAPFWIEAFKFDYKKLKYIRVQRIMNIRITKAYRTSSEALCILAGTSPIIIKTEEEVKQNIHNMYIYIQIIQ